MTTESDTITLGMLTSREDNRTGPHVLELSELLAALCKGPYSKDVKQFALILRIGGEMLEFDLKGCKKIKRNKRQAHITVDLGFSPYEWKGQSDSYIRDFLVYSVEAGLQCCLERLKGDGIEVDGERMLADCADVRRRYISSS